MSLLEVVVVRVAEWGLCSSRSVAGLLTVEKLWGWVGGLGS